MTCGWAVAMRPTAIVLALAFAALAPPRSHAEGMVRLVEPAAVDFRVVVPAIIRVKTLNQPVRLEITPRDIAQGFIDVDDATSLQVTSNSATGYSVAVVFERGLLWRVELRMPRLAGLLMNRPVRIGYRLFLNPEARAGAYRWPVSLTFEAHCA